MPQPANAPRPPQNCALFHHVWAGSLAASPDSIRRATGCGARRSSGAMARHNCMIKCADADTCSWNFWREAHKFVEILAGSAQVRGIFGGKRRCLKTRMKIALLAIACSAEAFLLPSPGTTRLPVRDSTGLPRVCHVRDGRPAPFEARASNLGPEPERRRDLLARREEVLSDMQGLLSDEEQRLASDLQRLQNERWRVGTEEWGDEQRAQPEEDEEGEEDLPTDWDSLPWSDGYKKAMQRADTRREERKQQLDEQGIVGNGGGIGALRSRRRKSAPSGGEGSNGSRRRSMGSIVSLLAAGSLVVAGAVSWRLDSGNVPDQVQQQLDLVNLVADCQNGVSYFR